ncbi:Galactose-3-O-sulfotransferase 3 [Holothuria leucospilota]|uniref:Galactose-3-O-sulfotransferase 3 n=1 Tax=Holothuria leucospilota TaxID=206669 RepID=A0A9Q1C6M1_HOLLE|nr:Galactose-3-O-sulfotransferase 3 [Holothuria leucospilota]
MLLRQPHNDGFHILLNHVRFNKTEMKDVMKPETKYVTILREPLAHWHSVVKYYSLKKLVTRDDPEEQQDKEMSLQTLLRKIPECRYFSCNLGKNGQFFDLGVSDKEHFRNTTFTRQIIEQVDKEFDLVLITEYFDESLILLKRMMCWRFEDILYIPKKLSVEKEVTSFSPEEEKTIRAASAGDVMLYDYFNRTLWRKIKEYGPNFDGDLRHFRQLNKRIIKNCVDFNSVQTMGMAFNYELHNNSVLCQNLNRDIAPYTFLLAEQVLQRERRIIQPYEQGRR